MDYLLLGLVILIPALVVALLNEGGFFAWWLREWRLMWADTWAKEPESTLGSVTDPKVANMVVKQRSLGKRMRRKGLTLLADKPYTPVLTKPAPAEESPPRAAKVVSIRSRLGR